MAWNCLPPTSYGFAIQIAANDAERAKLADKIVWHKKVENGQTTDQRNHKRIERQNTAFHTDPCRWPLHEVFRHRYVGVGCRVSADIFPEIVMPLAVREDSRSRRTPLRRGLCRQVR